MSGVSNRKVIEAILFVADEPVSASVIGQVLEVPVQEVEDELAQMAAAYGAEDRGFVLRRAAGGWRLYTSPDCAPWLERFVVGHARARLSAAALEVLAIVAYRQPISRAQIAEVRGVDSDGVVRTLVQRGLLQESAPQGTPGNPVMLSVSDRFLERMGLDSVGELPPLAGFMPDPEAVEDMEARLSPDA